jgi:hypothetical protein
MGYFQSLWGAVLGREPAPTSVEGTGGSQTVGGFIVSKEKNAALVGDQKFVTYDNTVLNTEIVAAGVRFYHSLISGVGWSLKPGVGPNANKYAERLDQMIKTELHQPWNQVVSKMAHYKWVGFSIQEWVAENMPDGFQAFTWFEDRPQSTVYQWSLEEQTGRVDGWIQLDPVTGQQYVLHRSKCVYIADKSITSAPDGVGMLRHVVEKCRQLQRLEQLEAWAYETDLRGVPIGRAPIGFLDQLVAKKLITAADKAAKLKGLEDFIKNHVRNPQLGILLDSMPYRDEGAMKNPSTMHQWDLQLAQGNGTGLAEANTAIERKQREIARAIGFEHLMLGGDGKGSQAQHVDKTEALRDATNATLTTCGWQLDQDVIVPIFVRNGWDLAQRPSFKPDALSLRSVNTVVDALEGMARAGAVIMPNDPVVNQVRGMLSLVEAPEISASQAGLLLGAKQPGSPGETKPKNPKK